MRPHNNDWSYTGFRLRLVSTTQALTLAGLLPIQCLLQVQKYLNYADPVDGEPIGGNWNKETLARFGYRQDIPGLVSELLAMVTMAEIFGHQSISIHQDKETQSGLGIDFYVKMVELLKSFQSKTMKFKGSTFTIYKDWFEGTADFLVLSDIDDHETFVIPMELARERLQGKETAKRSDLVEIATYYKNFGGMYS